MYFIRRKCTGPVFTKILILRISLILRILSKEFFLDLSVILRKILRIFVNTGPGLRMCIDFLPTHRPANQKTDTVSSTTATHCPILPPLSDHPSGSPGFIMNHQLQISKSLSTRSLIVRNATYRLGSLYYFTSEYLIICLRIKGARKFKVKIIP